MNWEQFYWPDQEVIYADAKVQRELQAYIRDKGIFSPESTTPRLKRLLSNREKALDALRKTNSEIMTLLTSEYCPSNVLVRARQPEEGSGRLWNIPPQ